MKKILITMLCFGFGTTLFAQKFAPEVKEGTTLSCSAFVSGQEFPLLLSIKKTASPLIMAWSVDGYGDGTFQMSDKAVESAIKMPPTSQPALGDTKLADDETFGMISKAAYKSLVDTKAFVYNGMTFKLKESDSNPMKMGGKDLDASHVVAEGGKMELWILNNASFPLVVQTAGMPTDIVVNEIK